MKIKLFGYYFTFNFFFETNKVPPYLTHKEVLSKARDLLSPRYIDNIHIKETDGVYTYTQIIRAANQAFHERDHLIKQWEPVTLFIIANPPGEAKYFFNYPEEVLKRLERLKTLEHFKAEGNDKQE